METELLLSHEVSSAIKGKDIFNVLNYIFMKNELDWRKLLGYRTDGASSMLSRKSVFQTHVKTMSPNVTCVHCFIPRFALCAKVLHPKLLINLNGVVKIVNFVKTSALNTRLFKCFVKTSAQTTLVSIAQKCASSPEEMQQQSF